MMTFFFSSRRRHTRLQGDWSSDVCSSDLFLNGGVQDPRQVGRVFQLEAAAPERVFHPAAAKALKKHAQPQLAHADSLDHELGPCNGSHGCTIDRKSTRLNSSHLVISYAVFCL